jgi:hypothetical protein
MRIYAGYEIPPDRNIKGSLFSVRRCVPSRLIYDDSYYQDIPVLLISPGMNWSLIAGQNFKISLVNDKTMSFTVRNHEFIRISRDSAQALSNPASTIKYCAGKTIVLGTEKKITETTDAIQYMNIRMIINYDIRGSSIQSTATSVLIIQIKS